MEHIKKVMEYAGFPEESRKIFLELCPKVAADSRAVKLMKKMVNKQFSDVNADIFDPNRSIATELEMHEYQYFMAYFLVATELMLDKYHENNIDEEIFWFAMVDYRCKLIECKDNYGIWGTAVTAWHVPFFTLSRFALGRFQYDYNRFNADTYTKNGITIKRGDPCLQFHIPSSGPLVRADRYDSYRRAYEFNRDRFGGIVPIACSTWLIYPGHEEFLPPTSNLLDFMHDFDFIIGTEEETFTNKWRVFGRQYDDATPDKLPTDTSLRRAYAKRLTEGGKTGKGYGILFHDENGVIR